jgi:hypothetical protein
MGRVKDPPPIPRSEAAYAQMFLPDTNLQVKLPQHSEVALQRLFSSTHWHLPLMQLLEQQSSLFVQKSFLLPHVHAPERQTPVQHPISALHPAP